MVNAAQTLTNPEIKRTLQELVGSSVTGTECFGPTIQIYFRGQSDHLDAVLVWIDGGWDLKSGTAEPLVSAGSYRGEGDFASDAKYHEYEAACERDHQRVAELIGKVLETFELSDEVRSLSLRFSGGDVIESSSALANSSWGYTNLVEEKSFEITKRGIESPQPKLGAAVARRSMTFEKDGKLLPATVTLYGPRAKSSVNQWDETFTSAKIETPFGSTSTGSSGVDGVQSTELCLMVLEVKLDRIAETYGATISHPAPTNRDFYLYRDELNEIHSQLYQLGVRVVDRGGALETPENAESLRVIKRCLDKIEPYRASKRRS